MAFPLITDEGQSLLIADHAKADGWLAYGWIFSMTLAGADG